MSVELLAPAGDRKSLVAAIRFGADAVYIGGSMLQLRAKSAGFDLSGIDEAVKYAHSAGKKLYVTVNAYAYDDELEELGTYAKKLNEMGVDAVIVSDAGVMSVIHKETPNLPIHVSTQANCTNSASAVAYRALGASRIVLARELSLENIALMRKNLPEDIELEAFVHGAMCMSYSGRCMISAYLTGRSANRGACTQPCRWNYALVEEKRPNEYFPIEESDGKMAILSSCDLRGMPILKEIIDAGIVSLKIEGRMKSEYYVATVVNAYRRAIDAILARKSVTGDIMDELECVSHRKYSTGFYLGELKTAPGDGGMTQQTMTYIAEVLSSENNRARIALKNKFAEGESLETVSPNHTGETIIARNITDEFGTPLAEATVPASIYEIDAPEWLKAGDMLRRKS